MPLTRCEYTDCTEPLDDTGTACYNHKSRARGTGNRIACKLCGHPQRDHALGYPEHAAILAGQPSGRIPDRWRNSRD